MPRTACLPACMHCIGAYALLLTGCGCGGCALPAMITKYLVTMLKNNGVVVATPPISAYNFCISGDYQKLRPVLLIHNKFGRAWASATDIQDAFMKGGSTWGDAIWRKNQVVVVKGSPTQMMLEPFNKAMFSGFHAPSVHKKLVTELVSFFH